MRAFYKSTRLMGLKKKKTVAKNIVRVQHEMGADCSVVFKRNSLMKITQSMLYINVWTFHL